jgi:hypothetical protein
VGEDRRLQTISINERWKKNSRGGNKIENSQNKLQQTGAEPAFALLLLLLHTACRPAMATRLNVRLCMANRGD